MSIALERVIRCDMCHTNVGKPVADGPTSEELAKSLEDDLLMLLRKPDGTEFKVCGRCFLNHPDWQLSKSQLAEDEIVDELPPGKYWPEGDLGDDPDGDLDAD